MTKKPQTASAGNASRVDHPAHYQFDCKTVDGQTVQLETVAIMEALFSEDVHLAQAWKYMSRAGRKPDSSYVEDVAKSLWWHKRALAAHGGHPEVK